MFISTALAQTAEVAAQAEPVSQTSSVIIQMVLLFAILYFLLIRPQQKRLKMHEAELNAIIKGSRVVVGGLVGKVVAIQDKDNILVEFTPDQPVQVLRSYVSQVLTESDPLAKKKTKG